MENSISERLKVCRYCQQRKFDKTIGTYCGLTCAKPTFDGYCPNYIADNKSIEIDRGRKRELEERASVVDDQMASFRKFYSSDSADGVVGWLAFFVWVGVVIGAVVSVIYGVIAMATNDWGIMYSIVYGVQLFVLLLTAVMTCISFYTKRTDAVSWAQTYIAMVALDGVVYIAMAIIFKDSSDIASAVRQLVWATIWSAFLFMSTRVRKLFPKETRRRGRAEKILLGVYLSIETAFVGIFIYVNKSDDPVNLILSDEAYIEQTISALYEELPMDVGDDIWFTYMTKESPDKIVCEYTMTAFDSSVDNVEVMREYSPYMKYDYLSTITDDDNELLATCFKSGYNLEMKYIDKNKEFIFSFSISPEEYVFAKNRSGNEWVCPKDKLLGLIGDENQKYPSAFSTDTEYRSVTLSNDDRELVYEIRFTLYSPEDLSSSDLLGYLTENWASTSTPLRQIAELNNLIITYRFTKPSGAAFRKVSVPSEIYAAL